MDESVTLLAHLVPRLTNRVEDAATDALAFILNRSESCRGALDRLLQDGDFTPEPIARFETQVTYDDGSRPDMLGYDRDGTKRLIVESKFWAGLQPAQPCGYLEQLDANGPAVMLFVAPNTRLTTLWAELERRMEECESGARLGETALRDEIRRAQVVGSGKQLMMVSWTRLLDLLAVRGAGDIQAASDIQQLRSLARQQDEEAFQPIHPEELGLTSPRRLRSLRQLIDEVVQAGKKQGWITTKGFSMSARPEGYGRHFGLIGVDGELFLCVNMKLWVTSGETPVWLQLSDAVPGNPDRLRDRRPPMVELRGWQHAGAPAHFTTGLPIRLKTGVEYEAVQADVIHQIRGVAELLDARLRDSKPGPEWHS